MYQSIHLHTIPRMSHESVRSVFHIVTRGTQGVVQVPLIDRSRIVGTESFIVVVILIKQLFQPWPTSSSCRAVSDHLQNAACRILRIESDPVVRLHDAWVDDAVVGGSHTDIASGLLHDDAKDSSDVEISFAGNSLDGVLDEVNFRVRIVEFHQRCILIPEEGV